MYSVMYCKQRDAHWIDIFLLSFHGKGGVGKCVQSLIFFYPSFSGLNYVKVA